MKRTIFILFVAFMALTATATQQESVAGLYPLEGCGRIVYNFNEGWRFWLGDAKGAESMAFDDSKWEVVCAPHIDRLEPSEASGGRNYQGVCWYRKHFAVPEDMAGKQIIIHFEAIMGKQWVYVNGRLVKEHLGGYLPITIDLSAEGVKAGDKCLIAVKADNSDDKNYPPGKQQNQLDFAYHGGMYRDAWLIGKSAFAITDAIERNQVAGGGVFIHYDNISEKKADVFIDVEVGKVSAISENSKSSGKAITLLARIKDTDGKIIKTLKQSKAIVTSTVFRLASSITFPHLWSPENPYLYTVELQVMDGKKSIDGGIVRMGIRKAEFRGKDGFWLNGKPYHQLVGGNRHQDFAYVGNAVPNSQQWRDVMRLKQAGMTIIRAAHYPQDPSFMDACDELGLFIIVPTPGWQFWNQDPKWGEMVHQNTRDIIRRDRNHPCVLMWEPILNETRYPQDFALKALQVTREEYPWPGRPVAAADMNSAGVKDNYDVLYDWPYNIANGKYDIDKCIFTREWGEYVDDWYAHNAVNRAARGWGEQAQVAAALSLADTYGMMFQSQRQFIGGCLWHPFDHQRGYHPDAYLGGIYDAFRQPPTEAKPIMIWQWMDGLVSAEGITADLEAYQQAGIGGVQQFLVGGPVQVSVCDSANAIGTDSWRRLMQHAISECSRLGLSFGSHNCPGWSSSAFPTVAPAYSMQKLVWTKESMPRNGLVRLPKQPEVDAQWNYYEDIAVLVMPDDSLVSLGDIHVFRPSELPTRLRGVGDGYCVVRFGHTTNGKTNYATAPVGGVGLECDKMSREAVRRYWDTYPQQLLFLAGSEAGKTFQRLEIDSYEAGGQEWTRRMPEEFEQRRGYALLPWLPTLTGGERPLCRELLWLHEPAGT